MNARTVCRCAVAVGALALATACPAAAQTVTGRVVDGVSRRPLAHVAVRLVPAADSLRDTTYAAGETEADGVFTMLAPAPGRYRVRIAGTFVGPALTLASVDATDERQYVVSRVATLVSVVEPIAPEADSARVYTAAEVQTRARLLRGGPPPEISSAMRGRAFGDMFTWRAQVECVVDRTGRCEPGTARVLTTNDAEYGERARDSLAQSTFLPAEVDGRPVRQRFAVELVATTRRERLSP